MKKYLKYLVLLTVVALLLSTASLVAFAENKYTEWTLSKDDSILSDGTRTFKRYDNAPPDLYASSSHFYQYANPVDTNEGYGVFISSFSKDSEIVWIYLNGYNIYYATNEGTAELDKFLSEGASSYVLTEDMVKDMRSDYTLSDDTVKAMSAGAETVSMNVRSLQRAEKYTVMAQNGDSTLSYIHGTVFILDDEYYYVEHSGLANDLFDADGNISLRNGNLPLVKLDAQTANIISEASGSIRYVAPTYTFEADEKVVETDISALVKFWVIYILIGFAAPIPLLAVGLILPHSQKLGEPRYWYKIAIIGAVWIVLAAILAVLLII